MFALHHEFARLGITGEQIGARQPSIWRTLKIAGERNGGTGTLRLGGGDQCGGIGQRRHLHLPAIQPQAIGTHAV